MRRSTKNRTAALNHDARREQQGKFEKTRTRLSAGRFCVLVTSSRSGARCLRDHLSERRNRFGAIAIGRVLSVLQASIRTCTAFTAVAAKGPSHWRQEVIDYLDALPEHIEYVLRIDEDALFMSPVDGDKLNGIADLMVRENLCYVSWFRSAEIFPAVSSNISGAHSTSARCARYRSRNLIIRQSTWPFGSAAICDRYCISQGTFGNLNTRSPTNATTRFGSRCSIKTKSSRRGRWAFRARRRLARQGLSLAHSRREFQTLRSWLRGMRERITFQLRGFLSFRIRRRLKRVPPLPRELIENQRAAASSKRSP